MEKRSKESGKILGDHSSLREEVKKKINNGALLYMDEKNVAETFLGKTDANSLEVLPQLTESTAQRGQGSAKPSSLKDVLNGFTKGHISVVGPAGSGKSTLLKTLARNVIEKKYEALSDVEVVVYIRCGDLDTRKISEPTKLLLSLIQPRLQDDELDEFENFATAYPLKVLFFLDGLDTFPAYFYKGKTKGLRGSNKRERAKDILRKLMEGELYKGCRVITTSRDSTELGQSKKSTVKVVNLSGLTVSSIKKITYKYFSSEEADAFISYLEEQPDLLDLCQTPMFLIFTLIGKKTDPNFFPTKMSEILLFLLNSLLRSKHSALKEEDLRSLAELCFALMKEKRVHFSEEYLSSHHLTVEKVQDLVVDAPGAQYRRMFFIHQSIVEIFACFHIISMKHQKFSAFTEEHLGNFHPDFPLVEQMLCGILLNTFVRETWGFLQVDSLEEKRDALNKHLNVLLSSADTMKPLRVLSLILSLHEAGESVDAMIKSSLRAVILNCSFPLSVSDVRAISAVVGRCDELNILALNRCWIQDEHIDILHNGFSKICPKISRIELRGNYLTADGMVRVGSLVRSCCVEEIVLASDASLTASEPQEALMSLKSSLHEYKLEELDISFRSLVLKECEMKEENRAWNVEVPYVVNRKEDFSWPQELLAKINPKIVWGISIPGLWRKATIEFVHAIGFLMTNVAKRIYVYNWKFTEEESGILRKIHKDTGSKLLEIHTSKCRITSDSKNGDIRHEPNFREKTTSAQPLVQVTDIQEIPEHSGQASDSLPSAEVDFRGVPPKEDRVDVKPTQENKDAIKSPASVADSMTNDHTAFYGTRKFMMVNQEITKDNIHKLPTKLSKTSLLAEFEFRNCSLDSQAMSDFLRILKTTETKIRKLSVTASKNIVELFPEMSEIMKLCETRSLNVERAKNLSGFLQLFLKHLEDHQIANFHELNLSHVKEIEDFETLGSIISGKVNHLKLVNCDLETKKLQKLCSTVNSSKIQYLDLSHNPDLVAEDITLLPKILCKEGVLLLALRDCCFSADQMEAFEDTAFDNLKVCELDLSHNGELMSDGIEIAGRVARKLCTTKLSLGSCELDEECLETLLISLRDHNVYCLNLRGNTEISASSETVAKLVINCKTKTLNISDCKLYSNEISSFADFLWNSKYKLTELNLSDSRRAVIDENFLRALCKVFDVVEKKLIVCYPHLEQEDKEMLEKSLSKHVEGIEVVYHQNQLQNEVELLTMADG